MNLIMETTFTREILRMVNNIEVIVNEHIGFLRAMRVLHIDYYKPSYIEMRRIRYFIEEEKKEMMEKTYFYNFLMLGNWNGNNWRDFFIPFLMYLSTDENGKKYFDFFETIGNRIRLNENFKFILEKKKDIEFLQRIYDESINSIKTKLEESQKKRIRMELEIYSSFLKNR